MTETDLELLRRFTRDQDQDAFTRLVQRHLDLVHTAAFRQVRSPQLAEEVAQTVFTDLASQAGRLRPDTILTAWLYTVTRRAAISVIRRESRRQAREQLAAQMNELLATPDPGWNPVEPFLDEAMASLDETDRTALLLRYFENQSLREVGAALGIGEDAAQKRVTRALDRLREKLARRGVTVGAAGFAALLSVHAVQAAPVGLAATITAAALSGTAATTLIPATTDVMTTHQKTLLATTLAAALGAGIWQAIQAARLRQQVQTLQQRQTTHASEFDQLQAERDRLASQIAQARTAQLLAQARPNPAPVTVAATPAAPAPADDSSLSATTNIIGLNSVEAREKRAISTRVAHMKEMLHLSDDQARSINDLLTKASEASLRQSIAELTGRPAANQMTGTDPASLDAQIKAQLTPDQLADFPAYQQAEKNETVYNSTRQEAGTIASEYDLTPDQQEQVHNALTQLAINQEASDSPATGNPADAATAMLNRKLQALAPILTPDQLANYREEQLGQIEPEKVNGSGPFIRFFTPVNSGKN